MDNVTNLFKPVSARSQRMADTIKRMEDHYGRMYAPIFKKSAEIVEVDFRSGIVK